MDSETQPSSSSSSSSALVDRLRFKNLVLDCTADDVQRLRHVFDTLEQPDTASYNSLLDRYAKVGDVDALCHLFHEMHTNYVSGTNPMCEPNAETYTTVLNALQTSSRSDAAKKAELVFNTLSLPDTSAYDALLNMYVQAGDIDKSFKLVRRMQSEYASGQNANCSPTLQTYATILNALHQSKQRNAIKKAEQIVNDIPFPHTDTYNLLLNMYAHAFKVQTALDLLHRMQSDYAYERNDECRPDHQTYTTILKILTSSKRLDAAARGKEIFEAISLPTTYMYTLLLIVYARAGDVVNAFRLVRIMKSEFASGRNKFCPPNNHVYAILLRALQKSKRSDALDMAKELFNTFEDIHPNTTMYNSLLHLYTRNGHADKALNLVHRMQLQFRTGRNLDCCPNVRTYNTVLQALHQSNLSYAMAEAELLFDIVPMPNTLTYNTIISMLAKQQQLQGTHHVDKALNFVRRMQSDYDSGRNHACRPNMYTYVTLFQALQKSHRRDASELAQEIFMGISSPTTVAYNLLLNIYANGKRNQLDVILVARRMQSDYESGVNRACRPNSVTKQTFQKALSMARDRNARDHKDKEANDLLHWMSLQFPQRAP
jgi:pentatricopeptide repeat protein